MKDVHVAYFFVKYHTKFRQLGFFLFLSILFDNPKKLYMYLPSPQKQINITPPIVKERWSKKKLDFLFCKRVT